MADSNKTVITDCSIEFRVWDLERFGILQRFFNALKRWSEQVNIQIDHPNKTTMGNADSTQLRRPLPTDPAQEFATATAINRTNTTPNNNPIDKPELWLLNLRPQDLKALGMPDHATAAREMREWHSLTRRERKARIKGNESLIVLADFADMLKGFSQVEVVFIRCVIEEQDRAKIDYRTSLTDYGSRASIEELLLFFGFPHIVKRTC